VEVLDRRRFLTLGAGAVGGVALSPYLSSLKAFAAPPVGANDGIVIMITLDGGNDGLNTFIPYTWSAYHQLRPTIAIPSNRVLPVRTGRALHPSLKMVKKYFDAGIVAIVQGVGYPNPDLSHFESMDIWQHGWGSAGSPLTGWLGRWVDSLPNAAQESLYAVAIDNSVPLHLLGAHSKASGLPLYVNDAFGMDRDDPSDRRMYAATKWFGNDPSGLGQWGDAYGDSMAQLIGLTTRIGPAYGHPAPSYSIGQQLALCAHLINANLGIRVFDVHLGGFDTHASQPDWHATLLAQLDGAVAAFYKYLAAKWRKRVVMMTFSEFGRRPEENGDQGTDHGTASVCFVIGSNVKGGVYGTYPSLTDLDQYGNLKPAVDFRSVYGEIVSTWLRAEQRDVLGRRYGKLNLFRSGPTL
jgi:uncharacterized protein (DUF1501 family)